MHVPASAPAVFIETEETDLTWAGLWCRAPATPTISGASEGSGVCDGAGKGPLASVVCVPAVLVFVPGLGSAGDCSTSVSTLAQQSRYLCGAVQARAHGCPRFSYLLKLGCCPSLCLHTHPLLNNKNVGK